MMQSEVFINTLKGERRHYTPVWFMRQAGRFLDEYKQLKEKYSFLEMCKTPELAAKVTLLPLKLNVDALIIFSDILIPLETIGANIHYKNGFQPKVELDKDFEYNGNLEGLEFLKEAIKIVKQEEPNIPLLGFAAAPFTLMCYLFGGIEFSHLRAFIYQKPDKYKRMAEKVTRLTIDYLNFQINAGCDAVQLFDSWGGILPREIYRRACMPFNKEIAKHLKAPAIYFIKNSNHINDLLSELDFDCFSIDSKSNLKDIYTITNKAVQGNLDNSILLADEETIKRYALKVLKEVKDIPHIFNLSHGILPQTNPDNVKFLTDFVHEQTSK